MSGGFTLLFSALCGVGFGYAAQRGSLCVVSGIETLLAGGSPRFLLSSLRCCLWVVAVSLPIAWVMAGDQFDGITAPTLASIAGGLLFGVGAAINGGCSFGTLIRLGGGDASFVATLVGLGLGFLIQRQGPIGVPAVLDAPSSLLETPSRTALLVLSATVVFCLREIAVELRRPSHSQQWPPERAALMMGITGGVLYALHGSWAYTVVIERGLDAMMRGGIPNLDLALIFLASLVGVALGAGQAHRFRIRCDFRAVPRRLLGGTVMGAGAALIPGGNDALVLHALPALSPHAPVAYAALLIGALVAIASTRALSGHRSAAGPVRPSER